jgi:hypothetical protein
MRTIRDTLRLNNAINRARALEAWDNRKTYDDRKQPDVWPIESDKEIAKRIVEERKRDGGMK